MPDINTVWSRIEKHAGETFRQIRGKEFTYSIVSGGVKPDTTNQIIPKSNFKEALNYVPLTKTGPLQNLRGPSYIFAILMDARISSGEW